MSVDKRLEETGQLRAFLADCMLAVKNGQMKTDVAGRIRDMAKQVNDSYYSEIKVGRAVREMGGTAAEIGKLKIR
jgi:hypothetical protein